MSIHCGLKHFVIITLNCNVIFVYLYLALTQMIVRVDHFNLNLGETLCCMQTFEVIRPRGALINYVRRNCFSVKKSHAPSRQSLII